MFFKKRKAERLSINKQFQSDIRKELFLWKKWDFIKVSSTYEASYALFMGGSEDYISLSFIMRKDEKLIDKEDILNKSLFIPYKIYIAATSNDNIPIENIKRGFPDVNFINMSFKPRIYYIKIDDLYINKYENFSNESLKIRQVNENIKNANEKYEIMRTIYNDLVEQDNKKEFTTI